MRNPPSISVVNSDGIRNQIPLTSHKPIKSSKKGNVCATRFAYSEDSIWYESTCIANIASDVLTAAVDHGRDGIRGSSL